MPSVSFAAVEELAADEELTEDDEASSLLDEPPPRNCCRPLRKAFRLVDEFDVPLAAVVEVVLAVLVEVVLAASVEELLVSLSLCRLSRSDCRSEASLACRSEEVLV